LSVLLLAIVLSVLLLLAIVLSVLLLAIVLSVLLWFTASCLPLSYLQTLSLLCRSLLFCFFYFILAIVIVCSSIFNFFLSCVNILCLTKTYGWSRLLVCVWPMCCCIVSLAWCSHDTIVSLAWCSHDTIVILAWYSHDIIARNQISSDVGNLLSSNYICTHNYYTIVLADNFQPIVYTFSATCN
jgi:hypothetical protein